MSPEPNNRYRDSSHSIAGRLADTLRGRHWSTFAIELALIVVGIVAALSIDDWAQEREDRRIEKIYLASLSRDLDQMVESLEAYIETETSLASASATALETLAHDGYNGKGDELREYLSNMGGRHTLRLVSSAYSDLTSTGNLQLIRSIDLREQLLRYFADVSRSELVIEKNNSVFVDGFFWSFITEVGITWAPTNWRELELNTLLSDADVVYREFLVSDIAYPVDAVLAQPAEAEIWNKIRRMCFVRLRVSAVGIASAATLIDKTETLKLMIDEELREAAH